MADPLVKVHVHEHTGTLILNRPQKRNALSRAMLEALDQGLHDLHGQRKVRCVVITGAGAVFCSGRDLAEIRAASLGANPQQKWFEDVQAYREMLQAMLRFPKPIIAALNGPALASGAGLALAADVVIAAPEASIGLPEPRTGLVAGVVAPLLTFRIGASRAASMLLTGEALSAAEAHRVGLFHEIVAGDLLWARSVELSAKIAASAPEALLLTKRMLNETIGENLETLFAAGAAAAATALTTEAAAEGLAAFAEKRKPVWP